MIKLNPKSFFFTNVGSIIKLVKFTVKYGKFMDFFIFIAVTSTLTLGRLNIIYSFWYLTIKIDRSVKFFRNIGITEKVRSIR